jgi:hypothetical protein
MHEACLAILTPEGEVFVLGLTSWWRRWFKQEVWAIAFKKDGKLFVRSPTGDRVQRFGHMHVVDDPDKWPDDVCAAVAKWTLLNA